MRPTDFASRLTRFFTDYLAAQRNVSPNTVKAYRDAFALLLRYCRDYCSVPPEQLALNHINAELVHAFLQHLEHERGCTARTRNHRLSAIHAFFRYLQVEEPPRLLQCQQILAIPMQRSEHAPVSYLPPDDLTALLAAPDLTSLRGRRDAILLTLLYDTGARVQEIIDLSARDVRLTAPSQVRLVGKGRKTRVVPLMQGTILLLGEYMREHGLTTPEQAAHPLFWNRQGQRLSRTGIRYILRKYVEQARQLRPSMPLHVSPHTLRHSKAMHLLEAGNNVVVIQAILGHADIKTSAIYAKANLEMKRKALEKAAGVVTSPSIPSWHTDAGLMGWLRSL